MKTLITNAVTTAANHGVHLKKDSFSSESMGLDFQVFFAEDVTGQKWVCRIPRRKEVFEKAAKEKKILDFITSHQSVFEVPVWEVVSEEVILYKQLGGRPAVTTDPDTQGPTWVFDSTSVPDAYINSLAQSLAALHALPSDLAKKAGVTVQSAEDVRDSMKERMNKIKSAYEVNPELWARWQKWVDNKDYWPKQTGLIHGDLFPGHTLINENYAVTGIIDWTEAEVSDTSADFTAVYMLFGEEALNKLIFSYQKAGGYVWPNMKEHIIERLSTQAITIAEFAESSGLEDYRQMSEDMLK